MSGVGVLVFSYGGCSFSLFSCLFLLAKNSKFTLRNWALQTYLSRGSEGVDTNGKKIVAWSEMCDCAWGLWILKLKKEINYMLTACSSI